MKLGYRKELISGLVRLHIKNKGNLNPDPLYSTYHFSHPELVERLWALNYDGEELNIDEKSENEEEKESKTDERMEIMSEI